jgi:hypothetical protein
MSKEYDNLSELLEKLKDPEFAEHYKKGWDFSHYKSMVFDPNKKKWTEEPDPIMDEFDKILKMLHESTHDRKIRESILLVQRYKTEYLDNKNKDE